MYGWKDGWTDGPLSLCLHVGVYVCMHACMLYDASCVYCLPSHSLLFIPTLAVFCFGQVYASAEVCVCLFTFVSLRHDSARLVLVLACLVYLSLSAHSLFVSLLPSLSLARSHDFCPNLISKTLNLALHCPRMSVETFRSRRRTNLACSV